MQKSHDRTYDFYNVKLSKMLRFFSVAETHGLIYPCPSGKNFSFALLQGKVKLKVAFNDR